MERVLKHASAGQTVLEGAGVKLRRMAGFSEKYWLDPFLLLDFFGSDTPSDYLAGFPWHPHRGIETITYMIEGSVRHEDSLGNAGVIRSGDVQWMTAGSGIIHQEMPEAYPGRMRGFQLWLNLPAASKMTAPKYRDIQSDKIPVHQEDGLTVKVICGAYQGAQGPVTDLAHAASYFDVTVAPDREFQWSASGSATMLVCVFEGSLRLSDGGLLEAPLLASFEGGEVLRPKAGTSGARFLLISAEPLREPIAWRGPIVMNTDEELHTAFREYHEGTFLRHGSTP